LLTGFGRVFPHKLGSGPAPDSKFYADVLATPFGDTLVLDAAWATVEAEDLGADDDTDLLAVGLSALDYCGHSFGPDSHEIMDMTVRIDRQLGEFFAKLDQRVGRGRYVAFVSSDHGIAPLVEHAQQQGQKAARLDEKIFLEKVETGLRERFGEASARYVAGWVDPYVYLNFETVARSNVSRETFERVAADAAASIPGVQLACTRSEIVGDRLPQGKFYEMIRRNFHPDRSGDVAVVFEPYHTTYREGTMHHGPHEYDTHVPLLLFGPGVKPGRYPQLAAPGDVAPTLAQLLGLPPLAGNECRVLREALE
jgi:predicted AlkP superfamily pyrophosphatase or phosphodiesterase